MGNEILRDMVFGCAGVLMVIAAIGLPRQAQAAHQQFQDAHLLPYYTPHYPQHRGKFLGTGEPGSLTP